MNRNNYFKYLRFDRLFTIVKLKQPSILWLAFLVSWFDNNSIYMWVVPCSPPKPRVLICCARPSHLKHWNSWKASAGPALHLAASPTRRLHFCPCSAFSSSLSHSFIRTLPPFTWSPWTPSFHWTWPAVPGQRSETENPFKMPTAEANTPQGWSSHHYCLPPGSFLPLQRNPVSASSHSALGTCALLSIWTLAITWDLWVWLLVLGAFVRSLDHVSIVCSLSGRLASMYEPHGVYPSVTDAFIHLLVVRNIYVWTELQLIQKLLPGSGVQLWES